ncbi:protease II [Brachybacterium faecium]|nr:protease II [Brachybacterium faecium]
MTQHTVSTAGQTRRTSPAQRETAPRPEARPVDRTLFGDTVTVRRRWLRDTRSAEVTAHFAAENVHADAHTAHLGPLRSALGRAFRGSTAPIELSAPVLLGGWWYIDRPAAADGALLTRVRDRAELRGPAGIPEIVPGRLLDGEEILVEDCRGMIGFAVSPDHRLLARAEAALGGCRVIVTEAATGELVDAAIEQAGPDLVFSADSRSLLHTRLDDLGRRHQVRCHRLGAGIEEDAVLVEEPDHWAQLELSRSRDGSAALIRSSSPKGSEVWIADLAASCAAPRSVTGRLTGAPPLIEHAGDRLLVIHEDASGRTALSELGLGVTGGLRDMTPLLTAAEGEHFDSVEAFSGAVALQLRSGGLPRLRVLPRRADGTVDVDDVQSVGRGGELDAVRLEPTPDWHQSAIRYRLDSFLTPPTILEHDPVTGRSSRLLQAEAHGLDLEKYEERRLWATSSDGVRVPISLIARRDLPHDGSAPAVLYGEGAFGTSTDPVLQAETLAVADRGVVVAVAHVRGGGELGPRWHRQGRRLHKPRSIADFLACAEHLVSGGWASPDRLGAIGDGSGGLLAAAAANLAPERFRAILTGTPLVDPLETLLDAEVMLTLEEWAEWGDPAADEATYRCLRSYSPSENVRRAHYPAVFAWTAAEGTDVPPACAAIWVAELRDRVTSDPQERPILLRTLPTMSTATDARTEGVAWLLDQLGAVTLEE